MRMFVAFCLATALCALNLRPAGAQTSPQKVAPTPAQDPQYWFGVAVENIPPTIAKQLKLRADQGVMIIAVLPGSPAEKAGLKADDLLIELNGKPLTSQEELARAANTPATVEVTTGKPGPLVPPSDIVYLREGNRDIAHITPERRPPSMAVSGNNTKVFTLSGNPSVSNNLEVRNYTLPNGSTVYVGPGYQVDSKSQGTNMRVLRDAVGKGDTLVLTQETDESGKVKNIISDGKTSYIVEPGNLDTLPANLRPIARQMLAAQLSPATKTDPQSTLEQRLDRMEKQNQELQKKLDDLQQLLLQNAGMKPAPTKQNP